MSEDVNLKISQFMDNELEHDDALKLLNTLADQPQLQHKLNRYTAISQALKSQVYIDIKAGFSENIAECIQKELAADLEKPVPFKQTYHWLALAVSLVIIAVIVGQSFNSQLAIPSATIEMAQQWLPEQSDLNKRISLYLKEHSRGVYAESEADVKPFAKATTYKQK
jgi:sigma-E factor negative regulatory protein RseA